MRLPRDRRRERRTRSPAASPRSPCVVSPYIDKNPQAERARARAGAMRSLRSGDPEVAGFTPPTPQLVPPWSGHGRTSSGPARRVLPRIFPGPTASRVGSLQWVWMGGEVREGNGCSLSRRPEPGKKGRCSV